MKYRIALLGFGYVGQGLTRILVNKCQLLKNNFDFECELIAISDIKKGSVYDERGLDLEKLLHLAKNEDSIRRYPGGIKGLDSIETITRSNTDVIVEVTPTDFKTGEPSITYCKTAFKEGKHVVTANKGPAALAYRELSALAKRNNVQFMIEGTVMSGTPVINLIQSNLAGNSVSMIKGILSGSTNLILTKMEEGKTYEEAVREAKNLGFLEADPTADVEGFDALEKVIILANIIMRADLKPADVSRKGITGITSNHIREAQSEGKRWKLIGCVKKENNKVAASVSPQKIPAEHPLAGIRGVTNAVTFSTDLMGDITILGPGGGQIETGYSLLSDLLAIHRERIR